MDLFDMLSIDSESPRTNDGKNGKGNAKGETKAEAKKKEKEAKAKSAKASAKPSTPTTPRSSTQADLLKRLVGLEWTIHYASHTFSANILGRQLVEMDEQVDIETVRAALYALIQPDVKEALDAAKQKRANATIVDAEFVPVENQVSAEEENKIIETGPVDEEETENGEEEDDLEFDDDSDEIRPKAAKVDAVGTATPVAELIEGDLTIDMLRQALALEYFEFGTEDSVQWRVDEEAKRLFPTITAAKMGAGTATKGLYWKFSEYLNSTISKPFNVVAGKDGRLYEIRESEHLRVTVGQPMVRELEEVTEGIELKMPKVPGHLLLQTINLFRHFAKNQLEALVYVAWNRVSQEYELHCPKQSVNAVKVIAEYPLYDPDREIFVIMHSHHIMDAYFSPTDNKNDQALCVYGVLGGLQEEKIQHQFRAGFNGKHFDLRISDVFNIVEQSTGDSDFPEAWLAMVERI